MSQIATAENAGNAVGRHSSPHLGFEVAGDEDVRRLDVPVNHGSASVDFALKVLVGARHAGGLPACTIGFLDRQGVEAVVQRNGMRGA